jgi:HSP20 family protein
MSLVRWDPLQESEAFFNRLLPRRFYGWPSLRYGDKEWTPTANVSETETEYVIRAELPAVKKEDIEVTVDGGIITIKGERKHNTEDQYEKYHRVESFYGSFERSFSLPDNAKTEQITCDSKDGVLTVHIPKAEAKKSTPQQITIQ